MSSKFTFSPAEWIPFRDKERIGEMPQYKAQGHGEAFEPGF